MSNLPVKINEMSQLIAKRELDFKKIASIHNAVNFEKECSFALQILEKNSFLLSTAEKNPNSLGHALVNVASIGLSLSPIHKMAYLVPRDGQICLDLSYMGLVQLAVDCGIIRAVRAEIVYENDKFKLMGFGKEPKHEFDPFGKDRGNIVGVYCVAVTHDKLFLVEHMSIEKVDAIKARSEAFKRNSGPWKTDYEEMVKKTVIKRAYKMWPKPSQDQSKRFAEAIEVSNSADPMDFSEARKVDADVVDLDTSKEVLEIRVALEMLNKKEEDYVKYCRTIFRRDDIKTLEDMTLSECSKSITYLKDMIKRQEEKKTSSLPKEEEKTPAAKSKEEQELDDKLGLK